MPQKATYSVCVLADRERREDLINKYSFINEMDGGNFKRVEQDNNPDFFIIDIDMPFQPMKNLGVDIAYNIEKCFACRPIIFVNTELNQDDCSSKKILKMLPFIKDFCDTSIPSCESTPCCKSESIPCCKSIDDLKKTLTWFRFIFKHDYSARAKKTANQLFDYSVSYILNRELRVES